MTGVPPTQPGATGGGGGSGSASGAGGAGSSGLSGRLFGGGAGKGGGTGGTGPAGGRGPSLWQQRKSLLEPVLVLAVGLALGVVDLMAAEVPGLFRVVAIIAGLVLAGHGMTQFELIRAAEAAKAARAAEADRPDEGSAADTVPIGATAAPATAKDVPSTVNRGVDADAGEDGPSSRAVNLSLGLAVLLAVLAIMNPTAPPMLVLLSLLAAYMLFAHGWRQLSARS